jgi:Zn-finger nucleic acid-binding protein
MDCPDCKNAMITLELENVEIDYCTDCGGIWLDAGELELLLDEPDKAKSLLDSFRIDPASTERIRKCPICYKKMQKIIVDRAELDEDNKIQKLLNDIFGQN